MSHENYGIYSVVQLTGKCITLGGMLHFRALVWGHE